MPYRRSPVAALSHHYRPVRHLSRLRRRCRGSGLDGRGTRRCGYGSGGSDQDKQQSSRWY
ncbi:hypothetical protein OH786_36640 (plasmid) [Streptomyces atratus]|uniref:hypothetical protein n=1 Tax=Streptomyces atratus TaxID=1893 RepID=UPI0015A5FE2F|nr:hypothetical protein [Streptomyces atratus]